MTSPYVTASMLYDLDNCEHRPWMDRYADPTLRDPVSPFVEMLWRKGRAHEEDVIAGEGAGAILNLRAVPLEDRERLTSEAMERGEPLIYGGRIHADDLLGEPDLLRREDGRYVPGDIKSGVGDEGSPDGDRKLKVSYGLQLALYVDVLERLTRAAGRRAFVWDINGDEVAYDLVLPLGPKSPTLWDTYQEYLTLARSIVDGSANSRPAYTSACKQCWWLTECLRQLEDVDDLTLIPDMGRSRRDPLQAHVATVADFAATPIEHFLDDKGKSIVKGSGADMLIKLRNRAHLISSKGRPYLKSAVALPNREVELFFDIETDTTRKHCYLHGFVERRGGDNSTETFHDFFSQHPTPEGERAAFAEAWNYVKSRQPCGIYVYSKYERTWWMGLQKRYPDVCSAEDVTALFAGSDMVDLFDVASKQAEWPTRDHSLKTLAKFLGFEWRDTHPSGAASIEWYERYLAGDPDAKGRILAYNEDDCRATRVLRDGIAALRYGNAI